MAFEDLEQEVLFAQINLLQLILVAIQAVIKPVTDIINNPLLKANYLLDTLFQLSYSTTSLPSFMA